MWDKRSPVKQPNVSLEKAMSKYSLDLVLTNKLLFIAQKCNKKKNESSERQKPADMKTKIMAFMLYVITADEWLCCARMQLLIAQLLP